MVIDPDIKQIGDIHVAWLPFSVKGVTHDIDSGSGVYLPAHACPAARP